jgi:thiol:disulfide interchange protein DsbD
MKIKSLSFAIFLFFFTAYLFGQPNFPNHVNIKSYQSFDKVYPGGEFKLAVNVKIDSMWHINSNKPKDENLIPSKLELPGSNFALEKIVYPPAKDLKFSFSETPLSVWEGNITIGALVKVPENISVGDYKTIVKLNYQSCNNITCLPPTVATDSIVIHVVDKSLPVNEINQNIFKNLDLSYTAIAASSNNSSDLISSELEHSGIVLSLIFVFLGGLALNLTPCVYPLIPITVGFFGGQAEGSTRKLFVMGLFFVIGLALTYSVIGVVTSLTGAVFGSLLQNPFVIIFVALVLFVLSLSMFGVYEFKLPDSLVAKAGGAKGGMYGAFFMGLTMGIVAAPCIGPFVLGLVTYVAAKGDPYYGFLMFFVLALGLGLPYLVLAVFSGKIKKLPHSGDWMDAVKHVFGFILIGMAIYFLLPLLPDGIRGYILPAYMLLVGIYVLFFEKLANKIKGFRIFKVVFSLVIIIVGIYSFIPENTNSVAWKAYSDAVVNSLGNSKKGTIIDFYADWCIPCKELEKSTFTDARVIKESESFNNLKADMTKSLSDPVERLRNKYDIIGVPTLLILNNKGKETKRITGYVNADEFYKILKNID